MAFYCLLMLRMSLELALENPVYADMGTKFLTHFTRIVEAINDFGGAGLWDEEDGFYYDHLKLDDRSVPIKVRSIVGLIPMLAAGIVTPEMRNFNPGYKNRLDWFLKNRPELCRNLIEMNGGVSEGPNAFHLLTVTPRKRLESILRYMFDEDEFLSPHGIRSVSKYHENHPYTYTVNGEVYSVDYEPGEGKTRMFGGNSNWRGPVWMPINFLIIRSLKMYGQFYGDTFKVEFPARSGNWVNLTEASNLLSQRVTSLFLPDAQGNRPCHGGDNRYATDPHWKDLVLFNEYFHGDTGRGCGASHQTGWTALVAELLANENPVLQDNLLHPGNH
jgi:hypothetical protein